MQIKRRKKSINGKKIIKRRSKYKIKANARKTKCITSKSTKTGSKEYYIKKKREREER